MHAPLGHHADEIAITEAVSKVPANTALDDLSRESMTPVDGIALNGSCHGKIQAKIPGNHDPAANAPEPVEYFDDLRRDKPLIRMNRVR